MEISDKEKEHHFVDDNVICGFFGEYQWLSNFYECRVRVEGITFPSSEHAYMAEKSIYEEEKLEISKIPTCKEVKKYGSRKMKITRQNWDHVRVAVMVKVLMAKFTQNPDLKEKLLATGNKLLEETNWWNDKFWGVDKYGNGYSMLGECLMCVRSVLKENI